MEVFAGLSVGVLLLAAVVVAGRTLALWRRTRGVPELLLGSYLMCATVLGYPLIIAMTLVPASKMWPLHLGGQVIMSAGIGSLLLFTLKVFRPDAAWARGFVGVLLLLFGVAAVRYGIEVTGENPRPAAELLGVNLLTSAPIGLAYLWTTFEALSYYRRLRLRLRLGLGEVVVANRVLLWGLMTLAAGVAVLINLVAMLMGSFMSAPIVLVSSCLGLVHACCLFLAFHAPGWYTAWLERRSAVEGAQAP